MCFLCYPFNVKGYHSGTVKCKRYIRQDLVKAWSSYASGVIPLSLHLHMFITAEAAWTLHFLDHMEANDIGLNEH